MGTHEIQRNPIGIRNQRWMGRIAAGWTSPLAQTKFIRGGEREASIQEPADLIFTSPNIQGRNTLRTIVELKCESLYQDFNMNQRRKKKKTPKFAPRIEKDLEQFGDKGSNIRDEYRISFV